MFPEYRSKAVMIIRAYPLGARIDLVAIALGKLVDDRRVILTRLCSNHNTGGIFRSNLSHFFVSLTLST